MTELRAEEVGKLNTSSKKKKLRSRLAIPEKPLAKKSSLSYHVLIELHDK